MPVSYGLPQTGTASLLLRSFGQAAPGPDSKREENYSVKEGSKNFGIKEYLRTAILPFDLAEDSEHWGFTFFN